MSKMAGPDSGKEVVVSQPKEYPVEDKEEYNVPITQLEEEKSVVQEDILPDIPSKILAYLQDDIIELEKGMSLAQADKVWGKPDKVKRDQKKKHLETTWTYGDYWHWESKLEGVYYYKFIIFEDGKLDWWKKSANIKIKTHTRDDIAYDNHLDEGVPVTEGMSKTDLYRLWGLPYEIDVTCFDDKKIKTKWYFKINEKLSHYAIFVNNKLSRWENY